MSLLITLFHIITSPSTVKIYMAVGPLISLGTILSLYIPEVLRYRREQYVPLGAFDNLSQPNFAAITFPSPMVYLNLRLVPKWLKIIHLNAIISLIVGFLGIFLPFPQLVYPPLPLSTPLLVDAAIRPLVLEFDRPFLASIIEPNLTPAVNGQWAFRSRKYHPLNWISFRDFLPLNSLSTRTVPSSNFGLIDTIVFYPANPLPPDTEYTVTINRLQPLLRHLKPQKILFSFRTPPDNNPINFTPPIIISPEPTPVPSLPYILDLPADQADASITGSYPTEFRLPIPLHQQHYKFSCFTVAAQMVLDYYQVTLSETAIWDQLPKQTEPRNPVTNSWGDPNLGIVGTIDGSNPGGYGAHWGPVSRFLSKYRNTEVIRQWTLTEALKETYARHAVIIWWVNGVWPAKDISWNLPDGNKVYTVNGMHTEILTGWKGDIEHPTVIYTNDPWRGMREYTPEQFNQLWEWFDNTAIIVK